MDIPLLPCSRPYLLAAVSHLTPTSHITTDGQSDSVGFKHILRPKIGFLLLSDRCGFVDVGRPFWLENGRHLSRPQWAVHVIYMKSFCCSAGILIIQPPNGPHKKTLHSIVPLLSGDVLSGLLPSDCPRLLTRGAMSTSRWLETAEVEVTLRLTVTLVPIRQCTHVL
jgi:hypothetical protein